MDIYVHSHFTSLLATLDSLVLGLMLLQLTAWVRKIHYGSNVENSA